MSNFAPSSLFDYKVRLFKPFPELWMGLSPIYLAGQQIIRATRVKRFSLWRIQMPKATATYARPYDVTVLNHSCPLDGVFLLRRNLNHTLPKSE